MLILDYLKTHSLNDLQKDHGVESRISTYGHKCSLNYSQIESKESDKLACQCRGIIVAKKDGSALNKDFVFGDAIVISYGMDRFLNYGQGELAVNLNDPRLRIMSKLDGTNIMLAYDPFLKSWCVATRGVSDADIALDGGKFTFRTLFEKCLFDTSRLSFEEFTSKLDKNITYVFELCSFYNRLVVHYNDNRITLLAARNLVTFKEIDIKTINIPVPKIEEYLFGSITETLKWVNDQNPLEHEGVVIMDSNFNRVKIKSIAHVACSRARDSLGTDRNCLELILLSKEDDVISILPKEIVDNIFSIKKKLLDTAREYENLYSHIRSHSSTKKEFAQILHTNNVWTAPFFNMYDGKAKSVLDFIHKNSKDNGWSNSFLDRILDII